MIEPNIAFINESTLYSDADLESALSALETQVSRDFAGPWDKNARLEIVPKAQVAMLPDYWWQMIIVDDPTQADALGYHDMTASGHPIGFVFVRADQQAGASVTVTMSHELLEMLADPWIMDSVGALNPDGSTRYWAKEICDPVEDDSNGYEINGILVSDFVTPSWFASTDASSSPVDFQKKLTASASFSLAPGGFAQYQDSTGAFQQISAQKPRKGGEFSPDLFYGSGAPQSLPTMTSEDYRLYWIKGSRRDRRVRRLDKWKRSTRCL